MKKSETAVLSLSKLGLLASLIFILLFSCDNLLKQTVIEDLTLEPPAMELIGANFDEEAQCYRSGFSVELSSNQRGVNIHYRLSMVGGTVQEGIYNGTPLLVGTHGKTFEFTAWCEAPQTLQSQTVGGRYYFEYQGLTAPLAAIEEVYLQTIDQGSNQLSRDSLISLENHPSSQGAQIYYTIPGHPEFPDNLYKLYEAPFLLEGNSSDQGINYTLLTHASLFGQVDTNGDGQVEDVELVPSSPDRAFGIRIRYPLAAPPEYSQPTRPEGFSAPFSLTLRHPAEGAVLHYSLDGSDPDPAKGGTLYESGTQLPIGSNGEGTQLRVYVTSPGCRSREFVQEYWINPELCPDPVITISPDLANNRIARSAVITGDNTVADSSLNSQVRSLVINRHFDLELSTAEMPQDGKIFYTLTDAVNPQLPLFEQDAQGQYRAVGLNGTREYSGPIAVDNGDWDWTTGTTLWLCSQVVAPDRTASPPQYAKLNLQYLPMPEPTFYWEDVSTGETGLLSKDGDINQSNVQSLKIFARLEGQEAYLSDGLQYYYERSLPTAESHNEESFNWDGITAIDNRETETDEDLHYSYLFTFRQQQRIDNFVDLDIRIDRKVPDKPVLRIIDPTSDLIVGSDGIYYINKNFMESAGIAPMVYFENPSPGENRIFTLDGSTQQITGDIAVNLKDFQDLTSDGEYQLQARTVDQAGNVSNGFAIFDFVVDTVAPEGYLLMSPESTEVQLSIFSNDPTCHRYAHDLNGDEIISLDSTNKIDWIQLDQVGIADTLIPSTSVREIPIYIAFIDYANNLSEIQTYQVITNTLFATNGTTSAEPSGYFDDPLSLTKALERAALDGFQEVRLMAGDYGVFPTGDYNFSIRGGYNTTVDEHGRLLLAETTGTSQFTSYNTQPGQSTINMNGPTSAITLSDLKFINLSEQVLNIISAPGVTIENCHFSAAPGNSSSMYITAGTNYTTGSNLSIQNVLVENFNGVVGGSGEGPIIIMRYNRVDIGNSTFQNTELPASNFGGSLRIENNGVVNISDSQFLNNNNGQGSAVSFSGNLDAITLTNNTFSGNISFINGGALYFYNSQGDISLSNNTFSNNKTTIADYNGGAIYITEAIGLSLVHNTFMNNSSKGHGGGIYASMIEGEIYVAQNLFQENSSQGTNSSGGAIRIEGKNSSPTSLVSIGNRYLNNTSDSRASTVFIKDIEAYYLSDAFEGDFVGNAIVTVNNPKNHAYFINCNFSGNSTSGGGNHLLIRGGDSVPITLINNFFYQSSIEVNSVDILADDPQMVFYNPYNNFFSSRTSATMNNTDYSQNQSFINQILEPLPGENYPEFDVLKGAGDAYRQHHNEDVAINPSRPAIDLDNNGNSAGIALESYSIYNYSSTYDPEDQNYQSLGTSNRLEGVGMDIGAYEY